MNSKLLHTPVGVRDIYGTEYEQKLLVMDRIHDIFKSYGYSDIQTPTFEFFDIFNKERGSVASKNMYKFFDREGNTLVLRPDMTPSIARAAAKYYMDEQFPMRFCYSGNAFINDSEYQGKLKEFTQVGAELLGDTTSDADAEVIVMVIESLIAAGLTEFQIEVGHPEYFKGIVEELNLEEE
ncbi:MAG: ATP phosphoribosyltransferase regulatory subunit, partial [Lachnospiraceae bacterium]|nr:ATP phosphoribosyltransferase regulatory subunit [Lachnospiraceae bacterium]